MVYLIHFETPYKHARHYVGYTESARTLEARIEHHRAGTGARLMQVVTEAGIQWQVVRTWPHGTRGDERRIKRAHHSARYCPCCNQKAHPCG